MALNDCPECGGALSSFAPACPHCGIPREFLDRMQAGLLHPESDAENRTADASGNNDSTSSDPTIVKTCGQPGCRRSADEDGYCNQHKSQAPTRVAPPPRIKSQAAQPSGNGGWVGLLVIVGLIAAGYFLLRCEVEIMGMRCKSIGLPRGKGVVLCDDHFRGIKEATDGMNKLNRDLQRMNSDLQRDLQRLRR